MLKRVAYRLPMSEMEGVSEWEGKQQVKSAPIPCCNFRFKEGATETWWMLMLILDTINDIPNLV